MYCLQHSLEVLPGDHVAALPQLAEVADADVALEAHQDGAVHRAHQGNLFRKKGNKLNVPFFNYFAFSKIWVRSPSAFACQKKVCRSDVLGLVS